MAKTQSPINMLRRFELWASLTFFLILLCMSIAGACVGSEKASAFFNSAPVVSFWILFLVLLVTGLLTFKRLLRKPGLLMIHLGCVLVLKGAMWSSEEGHLLQKRLFGIDKIPQGRLIINEGTKSNHIVNRAGEEVDHLPFTIWLEDFWIDYYWKEGIVHVKNGEGQTWRMSARLGEELELPEPLRKITILRTLTNLKVTGRITDRPRDRINPALDIEIEWADGSKKSAYAFPPNMPHPMKIENFEFVYEPNEYIMSKDFYSDLVVLDYENKAQVRKVIEVNKPLHYQGYHFYQHEYGSEMRQTTRGAQRVWYTVLNVVSDSGLNVVFTGYLLLCAGVFWHCWLRHIPPYFTKRNTYGN